VQVFFSEELTKWDSLSIFNQSDSTFFAYDTTVLEEDELSIITATQDTVDYQISLYNLSDANENITPVSTVSFNGSTVQDTLNPVITESTPKNGSTVKEKIPNIEIRFDKIIMARDIIATLKENETNKFIDMNITGSNSFRALFKPQKALKNFNSYTFTISQNTKDYNGNKLLEDLEINFMVTAEDGY
jgi:hypothetical protein